MLHYKFRLARYLLALLLIVVSLTCQAGLSVIVSLPPAPREVIVEPPGYTNCYIVRPGFYNGIWHYKHRVCEYESDFGLRMWVAGYWQCGSFRAGGVCTGWHWIGGHWANRHDMEFRRPSHRDYYRHYGRHNVHEHVNAHWYDHHNMHGHY